MAEAAHAPGFVPGQAVVVRDAALLATYGRAFRKIGKSVVVVPLGTDVHAGHIALIRAAKSVLGAYVFVVFAGAEVPEVFAREAVDVVFYGDLKPGVRVDTGLDHLESADHIAAEVAYVLAAINATHATDAVLGEKDFEVLAATQRAVTELRMEVRLHAVPTVRMPDGLALSLRNAEVAEADREAALVLAAALTAGAHAGQRGGHTAAVEAARGVFTAAGVHPEYVEVRDYGFGVPEGDVDTRLLAAVNLGNSRLIDNVRLNSTGA